MMSDVFILYAVVCYLFCFGVFFCRWSGYDLMDKIAATLCFCIAPIMAPIMIGIDYSWG